jgi:hypothetical protein
MPFTLALRAWFPRLTRRTAGSDHPFELRAGQRVDISLAPDEGLHIAAGEVLLRRPPRWIGDVPVPAAALRLREGDGWTSVERESVTLEGCRTSRVVRFAGRQAGQGRRRG